MVIPGSGFKLAPLLSADGHARFAFGGAKMMMMMLMMNKIKT